LCSNMLKPDVDLARAPKRGYLLIFRVGYDHRISLLS